MKKAFAMLPKFARTLFSIFLFGCFSGVFAHNKVVVVPLGGSDVKPLKNVIRVSAENGDYSSIASALASINNADEENPFVIFVGPGRYSVPAQLVVPPFVSIYGAGERSTTLVASISSNVVSNAAIIRTSGNSTIADMELNNGGGGFYSVGIYNTGNSQFENLTMDVRGGQSVWAFYHNGSTSNIFSEMESVRISILTSDATSSGSCRGVYNRKARTFMREVRILVRCSNAVNAYGVFNNDVGGTVEFYDSNILVRQADNNVGIYNVSSSISIRDSDVSAERIFSSQTAHGLWNLNSNSYATIRNSLISGTTNSMRANTGSGFTETRAYHTTFLGPVTGNPVCRLCAGVTGALDGQCQ